MDEIEVSWEEQRFAKPDWVGFDVTEDQRYYNFELLSNPYSTWVKIDISIKK